MYGKWNKFYLRIKELEEEAEELLLLAEEKGNSSEVRRYKLIIVITEFLKNLEEQIDMGLPINPADIEYMKKLDKTFGTDISSNFMELQDGMGYCIKDE